MVTRRSVTGLSFLAATGAIGLFAGYAVATTSPAEYGETWRNVRAAYATTDEAWALVTSGIRGFNRGGNHALDVARGWAGHGVQWAAAFHSQAMASGETPDGDGGGAVATSRSSEQPPAAAPTGPETDDEHAATDSLDAVAHQLVAASTQVDALATIVAALEERATADPNASKTLRVPAHSLDAWCRALSGRLHSVSVADCAALGIAPGTGRSVRGWPIPVGVVHPGQTPAGRILLIGGTHGDELTSVSLVFDWLRRLHADGADYLWHVIPVLNPDGLLATPAQRVNANGVDLNRNLPTQGWAQASQDYWQSVAQDPRRYPGPAAASEPETRWLAAKIAAFDPDFIVSVHAPLGVLDHDGAVSPPPMLGHLPQQRLGVFPGSLGNFASSYLGIPVLTVELTSSSFMPGDERLAAMWTDMRTWLAGYASAVTQHASGSASPAAVAAVPGK